MDLLLCRWSVTVFGLTRLAAETNNLVLQVSYVLLTKLAGGSSAEPHLKWQVKPRAAGSNLWPKVAVASQVLVDVTTADPGCWAWLASCLVLKAAVVVLPLLGSFGLTFIVTLMRLLISLDLVADTARLGAHYCSMCTATFLSDLGVDI